MNEHTWIMSANQQYYQPLAPEFMMESYPNNQAMSNVAYPSLFGQNEQEEVVRRAWIRPPQPQHSQVQESYSPPFSKQNKSSVPRTNPTQNRLPNLLESISEADIRYENGPNQIESQDEQEGLPPLANNLLPIPLTINPSATHDREFWDQHRQSSLTSNFFDGHTSMNLSGRPHTVGNFINEHAECNGDDSVLPSLPNDEVYQAILPEIVHTRLPHPDGVLLSAPTIKSDKIPIYSNDQMFGSWFNGVSSGPNSILSTRTHSHVPQLTRSHFSGILNPTLPFTSTNPLHRSDFRSNHWHITSDIVLIAPRSQNGQSGPDIHYPSDPRPEDVWHSLQEPNAPEFPQLSAATVNHLEFYDYGQVQVPRDKIVPPPPNNRAPGVMPYNSPPMDSYFHLNPKNRPIRQDEKLRFPADLYTPRWVRGDGPAREGFCSLCEEGSWLQLKTSQYWYHVRFTHGVNSNTGKIYDPPLRLRICDDPLSSTYGFCGECHQWIAICTPRRKRCFTPWFKHAHACHRFQHSMGHYLPLQEETSEATPAMSSDIDRMNIEETSEQSAEEQDELISSPPSQAEQSMPQINSQMVISEQILTAFEKDKVHQRTSWPVAPVAVSKSLSNNQFSSYDRDHREQVQPTLHERTLGHRRSASEGWLELQETSTTSSGSLINDVPHRPRAETSVKSPFSSASKGQKELRSRKKQSGILKSTIKK